MSLHLNNLAGQSAQPVAPSELIVGTAVGAVDNAGGSTITFTGLASGVSGSGRALIGVVGRAGDARTITGVTIGGQAATQIVFKDQGGSSFSAFYLGPVGANGNVVVSWSSGVNRCGAVFWPLENLASATAAHTTSAGGAGLSFSLNVPAGGAGFAIIFAGGTSTWTGLTERYDQEFSASGQWVSAASLGFVAAQTGLSVTSDAANLSNSGVAASFR